MHIAHFEMDMMIFLLPLSPHTDAQDSSQCASNTGCHKDCRD